MHAYLSMGLCGNFFENSTVVSMFTVQQFVTRIQKDDEE